MTALNPRQALTPAPMVFTLPGLYTHQNGTSPNIIGGFGGNFISNTLVGGTIGGGGTTTGSIYSLGGTIGQFDAGKLSGGTYTLGGGFWVDFLGNKTNLPLILH